MLCYQMDPHPSKTIFIYKWEALTRYLLFNKTLERYEYWLHSGKISPFALIRYYQGVVWQSVKHMVSLPRILFFNSQGPDFEFDGKCCSTTGVSQMLVDIYCRAARLLRDELLFGLTDDELRIPSTHYGNIIDELASETPGYCFLNDPAFRKGMEVLKVFMSLPRFRDNFYIRAGSRLIWIPRRCKQYLECVKEFKELVYLLVHILAGMPKRGSEEWRTKVFNTLELVRNVFHMLERLALIGNYAKTSSIEELDRLMLHFIPNCVAQLILQFFALMADIEKRFVNMFYDRRRKDWECFLFSSFGRPWTLVQLSSILKREMKRYLSIPYGLADLCHIIPAIAEHYGIMIPISGDTVGDHQQVHSRRLAGCLYSRTAGVHPKLNSNLVHSTMSFCDHWQRLMGFSCDEPKIMSDNDMHTVSLQFPSDRHDSELARAVKELLSILTGPAEGVDLAQHGDMLEHLRMVLKPTDS